MKSRGCAKPTNELVQTGPSLIFQKEAWSSLDQLNGQCGGPPTFSLTPLNFEYLALPQVYTFFRWRLYSLFDESSDKMKLAPIGKVFFYFFLRHYHKEEIFFTKSEVILFKIGKICWNYFYFPDMSRKEIFFLLFPPTSPQTLCRDPLNR